MRLTCPCCMGQFELEAALNIDAARSALVVALSMPGKIAVPLANYLACFRPKKRALQPDRVERLMLSHSGRSKRTAFTVQPSALAKGSSRS